MRINGKVSHAWDQLNGAVKEELKCKPKVMVYRGLNHAVFEVCLGLHLRFPMKKKIVSETGYGDHLKKSEIELAKKGVRFKADFEGDFAVEEKTTLAYTHDLDDALTAELYDHIPTLKKLAGTKIYRVHIAHHLFHHRQNFVEKLSEFDICICALDRDYALVFYGEKVTLPFLSVAEMPWTQGDEEKIMEYLRNPGAHNKETILDFESKLPEGVSPWFDKDAHRVFDRAAIVLKDFDGAAFQELYYQQKGQTLPEAGLHVDVETASYCRWQNEFWFEQSKDPERLRGLVTIDVGILNEEFRSTFSKIIEELKKLSQ